MYKCPPVWLEKDKKNIAEKIQKHKQRSKECIKAAEEKEDLQAKTDEAKGKDKVKAKKAEPEDE